MLGEIFIGFCGSQKINSEIIQIIYEKNINKKYECYSSILIGFQVMVHF
jgi:hypothetical protein